MIYGSIFLALVALFLAVKARGDLSLLQDRLDRLGSDEGASEGDEDLSQAVSLQRQFLARLAAGESLDPDQILESRAWGDVNQTKALELMDAGARILDVRTEQEVRGGIIPGAIWIPVNELQTRVAELGKSQAPLLVYCAMGVRSASACEFLSGQGFLSLHNLENGFGPWSGPTEVPKL